MSQKLEGKIAVITGGTEGIGLATAKLFVKEGAYVFITGRRQKELDEAVNAIGTNVSGVQGDVAQLADLDRLYETLSNVKARIDIVFANAGVGEFVPFGAVTEEHFDKLFNINVRGTLFTVQKALPMIQQGKPLTHKKILQTVWGPDHGEETENLRVVINQLRKKIEKDPARPRYVLTEPWMGYRFQFPSVASERTSRRKS